MSIQISRQLLEIEDLGIIPFEKAYIYQKRCVEALQNSDKIGKLLLLEHTPCITLGVSTDTKDIESIRVESKRILSSQISENYNNSVLTNIPIIKTDRGGKITAHNPGQLTGYPIINLKVVKLSIRAFMEKVLSTVQDALIYFGLNTKVVIDKNKTGLWVDDRKICFLGIKISRFITYHGFTLNVNNDLSIFNLFTPCGISDCIVTSVSYELGKKINIGALKRRIGIAFQENFSCFKTYCTY